MASCSDVCCGDCIPSNKEIQFTIETYKDRVINFKRSNYDDKENMVYQFSSHSYNCNLKQISLYDEKSSESSREADKLWGLFKGKRKYRASGHALRFFIDLEDVYKAFKYNDWDGCLVSKCYSHFIAHKHKLDNDLVNDLNVFFECYQYGDCIGIEDSDTYMIALSDRYPNELCFVWPVMDDGCWGLQVEYADAPKNYFIQIDPAFQFQLIDPLRLTSLTCNYDVDLWNEIEKIKNNEQIAHSYFTEVDDIDESKLDKFPNEYIAIYSDNGSDSKFRWMSRCFFDVYSYVEKHPEYDVEDFGGCFLANRTEEWAKNYDMAVIERRQRIHEYFHKISGMNSHILHTIIAFTINLKN